MIFMWHVYMRCLAAVHVSDAFHSSTWDTWGRITWQCLIDVLNFEFYISVTVVRIQVTAVQSSEVQQWCFTKISQINYLTWHVFSWGRRRFHVYEMYMYMYICNVIIYGERRDVLCGFAKVTVAIKDRQTFGIESEFVYYDKITKLSWIDEQLP